MRTGQSGQSATSPAAQFPKAASSAVATPVPSLPALPKPPRHRARQRPRPYERGEVRVRGGAHPADKVGVARPPGRGLKQRRPRNRNAQETAERPWESVGRGCVNIRDPGLRGAWTATRASDTAGRPAAPAPRGRGRVAEECRRRHDTRASKRPRFFLCPWWQRSKRRGVAAGSRGAPQRACALLSCDAHCVCVPGAGLRTARTGQQGLAGLAEARLQRCFRLMNRLVVTGAEGSVGGGRAV